MTLRGIVFDMDGVLCDSEPFIRRAAKQMFSDRYDIDVDDAAFMPFLLAWVRTAFLAVRPKRRV